MKTEYDFTKSKPNPYTKKLKQQITIRLDIETIDYFKKVSEETGVPYQNLINLYLMDCASKNKKPNFAWK
jgi:predicted DNA binding CopG/RHH family protein